MHPTRLGKFRVARWPPHRWETFRGGGTLRSRGRHLLTQLSRYYRRVRSKASPSRLFGRRPMPIMHILFRVRRRNGTVLQFSRRISEDVILIISDWISKDVLSILL